MKKQDELHQLVMKLQVISICTYFSYLCPSSYYGSGCIFALYLFSDADEDSNQIGLLVQ
jgi:hypothetical protein